MSLMNDIRAQMGRESGPVTAAQIAESLDVDGAKVRSAIYQASRQDAGIERHDDGTYSLVPGWKPDRTGDVPERAPAPSVRGTADGKRKKSRAKRSGRKNAEARPKRAYVRKATSRAIDPAQQSKAGEDELIPVRRGTLRALVHSLLESDRPVTPDLRSALVQLTSVA